MFSVVLLNFQKIQETRFAAMHWFYHYVNSGKEKPRIEKLVLRLFEDKAKSFATWIRLHDMDSEWTMFLDRNRPIADMASPQSYAAMLGLESVLNSILPIGARDADSSETVNVHGGRHGNALQAASQGGDEKVVQMLLDRGADVNAQGGDHGNALQAASQGGYETV